jgi:RNA polymerase sigma factor (sigma-70 family)
MMGEMQHEDLVLAAMPDARAIALAFAHGKASGRIDGDELIAIAYSALADAASRYDGSRPFKTFARYRVRGAILDALGAWSQVTWKSGVDVIQLEGESGELTFEPVTIFDTTRDMRALARAVESLGDADAAKITRYAVAETCPGKGSEQIHREFKMSYELWQYHKRRILAKLRFELQQRGITKVSDCL